MSNASRICAITGTNGYVGSRIRDYFQQEGWQIRELKRSAGVGASASSSWVPFSLQEGVPPGSLQGIDLLIHCAYDFRPIHWHDIEAVNIHGSERLFQAAHQARVKRIIFISSMSAFDGCRSMYGRAKLAMEDLTFSKGGAVVRPGLIYGRRSGGMFGKLYNVVGRSRVIPLVGRGKQVLYLAHEHDLCRILETVATAPEPVARRPIIAAGETGFTFKRILQTIAATHDKRVFLLPIPWRLIWAGLVTLEKIGLARGFRSDSLVSLVNQDPHPDFNATRGLGMIFRPFCPETILHES
jgi:nucleoside-diphosphate-sugar epimerase